jgi:glycosyltransferase involved in cell wall biosynthesis
MAHGLPIISSDLPTSEEIMGDFGLYFKNGDAQELAKKLEDATMIDWAAKSQQAYEIARRFDVTTIVKQWKSLLDK